MTEFSHEIYKKNSIAIFNFKAEARKIESRRKKLGLKTFGDSMKNIWDSFSKIGRHVDRIDVIFDYNRKDTIKGLERQRRNDLTDDILMSITQTDQPLPLATEFHRFWASSENKIRLQKFFISCLVENYDGDKMVYLGGCHEDSLNKCYKLVNGTMFDVPALRNMTKRMIESFKKSLQI